MGSRADIIAGGAAVEIKAIDYTKQVFSQVESNLYKVGASAMKIGGMMLGAAAAAAGSLAAFTIATASSAAEIDDASKRTGVGAEALQELRFGAEQSGTDLESLTKGFRALNIAMATDEGRKKLEALGLSLAQLDAMSPEDRFTAVAEAIRRLGDESKQAAAANDIFGKAGWALLPFLQEGAAGINAMRRAAQESGQVLSGEAVAGLAALDDAVAKVTGSIRGLAGMLAGQLAPYITPIVQGITAAVAATTAWLAKNDGFTAALVVSIGALAAAGAAVLAFGFAVTTAGAMISAIMAICTGVAAAASVVGAPILIIAGALAAYVALLAAVGVGLAFLLTPMLNLKGASSSLAGGIQELNGLLALFKSWIMDNWGGVIGGMIDAFANGNLGAAAELAFVGIQIAAVKTWAGLLSTSRETLAILSSGWARWVPGIQESFAAFEEMNEQALRSLKLDAERLALAQKRVKEERAAAEAAKQAQEAAARAKADEEAAAAKMKADGELHQKMLDDWLAAENAKAAEPVAEAIAGAGRNAAQQDRFMTSSASVSGAAAFLGSAMQFKPLEDLQRKANEQLAAINRNTKDGLGVQIS